MFIDAKDYNIKEMLVAPNTGTKHSPERSAKAAEARAAKAEAKAAKAAAKAEAARPEPISAKAAKAEALAQAAADRKDLADQWKDKRKPRRRVENWTHPCKGKKHSPERIAIFTAAKAEAYQQRLITRAANKAKFDLLSKNT